MSRLTPSQIAELETLVERWGHLDSAGKQRLLSELGDDTLRILLPLLDAWTDGIEDLPAGFECGDFKLLDRVGSGGFGVVYRALQPRLPGVKRAIKILRPDRMRSEDVDRFNDEMMHLIRLSSKKHPGLVHIYDAQSVRLPSGALAPFVVTEFVEGKHLDEFCGALDEPPAKKRLAARVKVFVKVCEALRIAHQGGIVHGDLKPENILVTAEGQPVIMDFGLAQKLDPAVPMAAIGGSVPFMSPEHFTQEAGRFGTTSDVYSLGILLFAILTGGLPYHHAINPEDTQLFEAAITGGVLPRLHEAKRKLPKALFQIISKALARKPNKRFESVADLGQNLSSWLATIEPRPHSLRDQLEVTAIQMEPTLKAALKRTLSGKGTTSDKRLLYDALASGKMVHVQESEVDVSGDIVGSIVILGNNNQLSLLQRDVSREFLRKRVYPQPKGIPPPFQTTVFLGRASDTAKVRKLFTIPKESAKRRCIVLGWPGVGKTTFLGHFARDPEIMEMYSDGILWTSVGESSEPERIFSEWGRALGDEGLLGLPSADEMAKRVRSLLASRRMLLLIDDVWQADDAALIESVAGSKCGVLISTRLDKVAEHLADSELQLYRLPCLSEIDSLSLVRVLAPKVVQVHSTAMHELVLELEGLPLSLHVAARLLRVEEKRGLSVATLLEDIIKGSKLVDSKAPRDRIEKGGLPTLGVLLDKSVKLLDALSRECFAYLGVMAPKPATFDLEAMKFIWRVEMPEKIVCDLLDHGLLEHVGKGRYWMHAVLVAHARTLLT